MENSENKNSKPKWSLLFWIGAIFCFVIFPVFLLDVGLDSYINTKNESERQEAVGFVIFSMIFPFSVPASC